MTNVLGSFLIRPYWPIVPPQRRARIVAVFHVDESGRCYEIFPVAFGLRKESELKADAFEVSVQRKEETFALVPVC